MSNSSATADVHAARSTREGTGYEVCVKLDVSAYPSLSIGPGEMGLLHVTHDGDFVLVDAFTALSCDLFRNVFGAKPFLFPGRASSVSRSAMETLRRRRWAKRS